LDLRVLGPVEAAANGRPLPLGAKKQRAVLAMLVLEANRPVSSDRLVEGLWGESPPPSAPKMVQLYVSQLRKALRGHDVEIVTRGGGYQLSCRPEDVDLTRVERLVTAAANGAGANGEARAALALWRGAPLADVADEPFAAAEIRRCDELWLQARELAIDADLAAGRHEEALRELPALAADHPLREHLQAQWMLALYRAGRQAEALEAYRTARARLVDAIGAEPGPELRACTRRSCSRIPPWTSRLRHATWRARSPRANRRDSSRSCAAGRLPWPAVSGLHSPFWPRSCSSCAVGPTTRRPPPSRRTPLRSSIPATALSTSHSRSGVRRAPS
jgi:DNA-binding SARP family transcriptional activator